MTVKVPPIIFWPHIKHSSSLHEEANINSCKYFKIISCYNKWIKKSWITSCFIQQKDGPNKCMLNKLNKRDHLFKLNGGHPVPRWSLMPALL